MTRLLVGFPVLGRPGNAPAVTASLRASMPDADFVFLCSHGDTEEIAMCRSLGRTETVGQMSDAGQFARKHNHGFRLAAAAGYDWYLTGADDLTFHPGWYDACMRIHDQTGACVVGTNDMHNQHVIRGKYATHCLVHCDYLECGTIDEPGKLMCELYDHQSVDIELCQTANYRHTYAHAFDAHVEHNHPHWGLAEMDATYEKALRKTHEDIALFNSRRHLWSHMQRRAAR